MKKEKYRNYGGVDFEDHEIENREDFYEKEMEEIEGDEKIKEV